MESLQIPVVKYLLDSGADVESIESYRHYEHTPAPPVLWPWGLHNESPTRKMELETECLKLVLERGADLSWEAGPYFGDLTAFGLFLENGSVVGDSFQIITSLY